MCVLKLSSKQDDVNSASWNKQSSASWNKQEEYCSRSADLSVIDTTRLDENTTLLDKRSRPTSFLHQILAYVTAFASVVLMCVASACAQLLGASVPLFELNLWRFGAQLTMCVPFLLNRKCDLRVRRRLWWRLALITLCLNVYPLLFYTAAAFTPIGTLSAFKISTAIVGTAVVSLFRRSERRPWRYVAGFAAVVGVFFLMQPSAVFSGTGLNRNPPTNWTSPCERNVTDSLSTLTISTPPTPSPPVWIGYVLGVSSGLVDTLQYPLVRSTVSDMPPTLLAFWTGAANLIISTILMLATETPVLPVGSLCLVLLLLHAFAAAQFALAMPFCLGYIPTPVFAVLVGVQMTFTLIIQYTLLKNIQPGLGNWLEIVGAGTVFVGTVGGPTYELIKTRSNGNTSKPSADTQK